MSPSIEMPHVFDSPDPKLMYGFVSLAKMFTTVDDAFITAWRDQSSANNTHLFRDLTNSMTNLLRPDDVTGASSFVDIDETQRLDILVTQHWLRSLVCQLHMHRMLRYMDDVCTSSPGTRDANKVDPRCVLDTSRGLLEIISASTKTALEAHGIGIVSDALRSSSAKLCFAAFGNHSHGPKVHMLTHIAYLGAKGFGCSALPLQCPNGIGSG